LDSLEIHGHPSSVFNALILASHVLPCQSKGGIYQPGPEISSTQFLFPAQVGDTIYLFPKKEFLPMPYLILTTALVALDQLVKYLVVQNISPGQHVPLIPYIIELTYIENTGAAFNIFSGHTWVLTLVSFLMSAILAVAVVKRFFRHPFGRTALTVVLSGAVGNLIDRVAQGYVVDMFNFLFIRFAVFNVADICVVLGGIAAAVYYLFFYEKLEGSASTARKGTAHDTAETDR